nr:YjaG family protein [Motiliproteus sediminis]
MSELCNRLESLDPWQLTLFTTALAERQYPNYQLFTEVTDWGDADQARRQLDKLWERLANRTGSLNVETQLEKLETITPDPDDFDFYGVQPALDFCVCLHAAFAQQEEPSFEEAGGVAQVSMACVDTFLELTAEPELSDEELVRYINTHELMVQEEALQQQLLEQLLAGTSGDAALVDQLRQLAANDGVSNIGISIDD